MVACARLVMVIVFQWAFLGIAIATTANIAILSARYDAEGNLNVGYRTTDIGTIRLALFWTDGTNNVKTGREIYSWHVLNPDNGYGEHKVPWHRLGIIPVRFTRVLVVADPDQKVNQTTRSDDRRAVTALLGPGFRSLRRAKGIAWWVKDSLPNPVIATQVDLQAATLRLVSNGPTGNQRWNSNGWYATLAKAKPNGRTLRVMMSGTFFGPELWYLPLVKLYHTHGLVTNSGLPSGVGAVRFPAYQPQIYSGRIDWNNAYGDFAYFPGQPPSEFTSSLGGIVYGTKAVDPASTIARHWVTIGDGIIINQRARVREFLFLTSEGQTAEKMWGKVNGKLPGVFLQLDAGSSLTYWAPGVRTFSRADENPIRYLPHALGLYSN